MPLRSVDEGVLPSHFRLGSCRAVGGGKLQHGCKLALAQTGQGYDLPAREFERIVMSVRLIHIDLPEPGYRGFDLAEAQAREEAAERMVDLDLIFERHLGAGQEAHCNVRLSDGSEATGY